MPNDVRNVRMAFEGEDLVIRIDLSQRLGPSASGKTTIVASTGGSVAVGNGIFLGLNAWVK